MDRRGCLGVLAAFLLISVAARVGDAAAVGRLRILTAERSKSGQEAGSQKVEGGGSSPSSVPKKSPPPGYPPNSTPASHTPPNLPLTPRPTNPPNPASTSGGSSIPASGSPSHPPPAPAGPVNPSPSSSGSSLDKSPPPGSPLHTVPAGGHSSQPPPPGNNHPSPAEAKLRVPSEPGGETPTNGKDGKEKRNKKQSDSSSGPDNSQEKGQGSDNCNGSSPICHVKDIVACLRPPQNEPQAWSLVVQNKGENHLNVNITALSSMKIVKTLPLPQHSGSKIEFHADASEGLHIVLNAGNGNCTLYMPPPSPSVGNFFQHLPNYANLVTPVYGVYLVSLTVIFAGGTWACCKFRKRRRIDSGVAYQQLEMGTQQQSGAPDDEDVMNGWEESWNDDWDEEAAEPRHPGKQGSASENGVTFRSSDKSEWEDWDD